MPKVAIITDSIACLTRELVEKYRIGIVPIHLLVRGKIYRDGVDMTPSQAYQMFLEDPDSFETSPSSPGHYLEAYREASRWADSILCITLSSRLSTGYNMAEIAREQAEIELPQTQIAVMDSLSVTAAEGFIALAAARAAADGKDLAGVIRVAEAVKGKVSFLLLLDTIRHVYRTGRIPRVVSAIGEKLSIKPILTIADGQIRFKGMVRNREQGLNHLLEMLRDRVDERPVHITLMHAYSPDEAERLKERVTAEFNCVELWVAEFSPVMGYATGTGTIGFAFYTD